jgi:hypothetical protein
MNTYTWKIDALDCTPSANGKSNVVSCVHWRVKGDDGTNQTEIYGTQTIQNNVETPFINYQDLTIDNVILWVQEAIGEEQVASIYASLDNQLVHLANPSFVNLPLPWADKPLTGVIYGS